MIKAQEDIARDLIDDTIIILNGMTQDMWHVEHYNIIDVNVILFDCGSLQSFIMDFEKRIVYPVDIKKSLINKIAYVFDCKIDDIFKNY